MRREEKGREGKGEVGGYHEISLARYPADLLHEGHHVEEQLQVDEFVVGGEDRLDHPPEEEVRLAAQLQPIPSLSSLLSLRLQPPAMKWTM